MLVGLACTTLAGACSGHDSGIRAGSFEVLRVEVGGLLRAFVTLVRQNVSSSLSQIFSVRNSDLVSRIPVAFTACSSSAQERWKASM
jgi:hypothetical protein